MAEEGRCSLGGARSGRKESPPVCKEIPMTLFQTVGME